MTDPESPDTPSRFSRQETAHIQQMIVTPDAPIVCPRCGGELELGEPLAAGHSVATVWEVKCASCQRSALVRDLPEEVRASREWQRRSRESEPQ